MALALRSQACPGLIHVGTLRDWNAAVSKPRPGPWRVVFFGSPAIAVPSLEHLASRNDLDWLGVVSQPDRPAGRGHRLQSPAVVARARELGLPCWQPERLRGFEAVADTWGEVDLFVVIAYGRILPDWLLLRPRIGALNLHASLLPRHRGAAPIQAAILAGDAETGICLMGMEPAMDAGPVLHRATTAITEADTAGSLFERMGPLAARVLAEGLDRLANRGLAVEPQDETAATHAGKIDSDTARVDWRDTASEIDRQIRAMTPRPGAWTLRAGERLKILRGRPEAGALPGVPPGTVLAGDLDLRVACGEGVYVIEALQAPGKRPMPARDYLQGRPFESGQRLGDA